MATKGSGDRKRLSTKITHEEKGQRTERSTDVYLPKRGMKETAVCGRCHLVYQNKRWLMDEAEARRLLAENQANRGICPACRRMEDSLPAGIATFSGGYFGQHEREILDIIKNTESKSRVKNPLGRVMEIAQEGNVLTVSTTEDKLAQKLGREVYRAHKGELRFQWAQDQNMVRVNWQR
ncbi:MAG TPA: BCAM0308 family protein [Desulfuromonadaceae bacterium]